MAGGSEMDKEHRKLLQQIHSQLKRQVFLLASILFWSIVIAAIIPK